MFPSATGEINIEWLEERFENLNRYTIFTPVSTVVSNDYL